MWRLVIAASLLMTLGLATAAVASPCSGAKKVCVESITAQKGDGGTALSFSVLALEDGFTLPDKATAVVMQVDGDRSKCIDVALVKGDQQGDRTTYSAVFTPFAGYINDSFTGRLDIAGDVFEFTATIDGQPGTVRTVTSASGVSVAQPAAPTAPVVITAVPAPSAQPAAAPASQPDAAPATAGVRLDQLNPVALLGLIAVLATAAGAYLDRRRSLARATAG